MSRLWTDNSTDRIWTDNSTDRVWTDTTSILVAESGSYTITGTDAASSSTLVAESGSYTITGTDAASSSTLTAESGSYAVTGTDIELIDTAESGSYTITGTDAALGEGLTAGSGSYAITGADLVLTESTSEPIIYPSSGDYLASQSITMSCNTPGANIYYTLDGTDPDSGSSLYSTPLVLTTAKTIKAIGITTDYNDSSIVSETYTISVAAVPTPTKSVLYSWLFEVGTNYWSTKAVTYDGTNYSARILPDSFSGITLQNNLGSTTLVASNTCSFSVLDNTGAWVGGEDVVIRLLADGVLKRSWKFKSKRITDLYYKVTFICVDPLKDKLTGSWPDTKQPRDVFPSNDPGLDPTDDYCVPVVLGTAYIPLRSVFTGSERYYLLGITGPTYDVLEVSSPHDWGNSSTWVKASYNFAQSNQSSYRGLQPEIQNLYGDGSVYAPGFWRPSDTFLDMPTKFTRSDTSAITSPDLWIKYVLESFGVASADINILNYANRSGLDFNGGWWEKKPRESIIASLLSQCDCYLTLSEEITLRPFSKTSVETFSDCLEGTINSNYLTHQESDGGSVVWQNSGKPQDELTGQTEVATYSSQSAVKSPYGTAFQARFISDSQDAQRAALLHFQKIFLQKSRASFAIAGPSITRLDTLSPGMVVKIDNYPRYGYPTNYVITKMVIAHDLKVTFTGIELVGIEEWADITPSAVTIATDNTIAFPNYPEATVNDLTTLTGGTVALGTEADIDLDVGDVVIATISTATQEFSFSNPPAIGITGSFVMYLTDGGSQTIVWPTSVAWEGGIEPTLTTSGTDVLVFTTNDSGTIWMGFVSGLDMK